MVAPATPAPVRLPHELTSEDFKKLTTDAKELITLIKKKEKVRPDKKPMSGADKQDLGKALWGFMQLPLVEGGASDKWKFL